MLEKQQVEGGGRINNTLGLRYSEYLKVHTISLPR